MRKILIATAGLAAISSAPVLADNAAANAVYERMQAAGDAPDPASLVEKVYAPDATYLPSHKDAGIERRDMVVKMMVGSQQHLRNQGGRVDIKFRIVDRKRLADGVYVDNGYMQTTLKRASDAPEQVTYGKFVTVIARQPQGHWAFVTDADSGTAAANFDSATPVPGLKFDE